MPLVSMIYTKDLGIDQKMQSDLRYICKEVVAMFLSKVRPHPVNPDVIAFDYLGNDIDLNNSGKDYRIKVHIRAFQDTGIFSHNDIDRSILNALYGIFDLYLKVNNQGLQSKKIKMSIMITSLNGSYVSNYDSETNTPDMTYLAVKKRIEDRTGLKLDDFDTQIKRASL